MNNDFLVKTSSPLAIQYNDLSPLENHHLAQTFRLLNRDDCGLLRHLSKDKQVVLLTVLITIRIAVILMTIILIKTFFIIWSSVER